MHSQRWPHNPAYASAGRYAVALLGAVGLAALYLATGRTVEVVVDGQPRQLFTHARSNRAVLRELGLAPRPNDMLRPSSSAILQNASGAVASIELRTARPVLIRTPVGWIWHATPETQPANILASAGLAVFPGDAILVDGLPERYRVPTPGVAPSLIELRAAHRIRVHVDGVQHTIMSAAPTLGQALWESGLVLHEADSVTPGPETPLTASLEVVIARARSLQVALAGRELRSRSSAPTIGAALAQIGLPLLGLDYSIPPADRPPPDHGRVRVVRVQEIIEVEQQPLPFETTYQPVDDLELDRSSVIQAGAYGVSARRIRIRVEDGAEVSRNIEGEWIAQPPRDQIQGYGTQIQVRSIASDDGVLEYWRAVQMYATSYSPSRAGVSPDSPWYGITASGKPLRKGLVAIDRRLIPFGTMMYVPGYGFAEAADTGGGVRGRWIDLGYDDDNYVPWSRYVTVYFLTPVPPASSIVWIFP